MLKIGKFLKHGLIISLWPIAALLIGSATVTVSDELFNYGDPRLLKNAAIQTLSFGILGAGFLAVYASFKINRLSAFMMMALPSIALCFFSVPFYPVAEMILPYLLFGFVRTKEKDEFQMFTRFFRNALGRKKVRAGIGIYVFWVIIITLIHSPLFEELFGVYFYNAGAQWLFFVTVPPVLTVIALVLFSWYQKAADSER